MNIRLTPEALKQLEDFQLERKFSQEEFYPGAPSEEIRCNCERRVNVFVHEVVSLLQRGTKRDHIFGRAKALIRAFADEDTEEREKADDYICEVMRIIGLEDWTEHVD